MADLPVASWELTEMRTALQSHLQGTAILYAPIRVADGQGGVVVTYAASGTVDALLAFENTKGDAETLIGDRVAGASRIVLTVPQSTTVDETYRVSYAGSTYQVVEVITRSPMELSRRVRVEDVS